MRDRAEVIAQVAYEKRWMAVLGVPAVVGGVFYLLSAIIVGTTLRGAPTVGILQGLEPALSKGLAQSAVSPRAAEVEFVSHHALPLIAGSTLSSLAIVALTATLVLLCRASNFRRPESWSATLPLVVVGGLGFAVVGLGHQIAEAVLTHQFAVGGDFSAKAVESALSKGPANVASQYISLLAGLSLAVGMIAACLNGMRVGLVTRWLGIVGVVAALLIFLPIGGEVLEVVPAFWLAAMGLLYLRRWPGEEPPAWAAGEARPWPTQADRIAERQEAKQGAAKPLADRQGAGRQGAGRQAPPSKGSARRGLADEAPATESSALRGAPRMADLPSPPRGRAG